MNLVKEARKHGVPIQEHRPKVHCKAFEDNTGALEISRTPKMQPRTKHLNIKYHHFREYVQNGSITIHSVPTEEQQADIFTKALGEKTFVYLRAKVMGW